MNGSVESAHQEAARPCELCEAARTTPWYHEDDLCWVAECESCWVPMVVWRSHDPHPSDEIRAELHRQLAVVVEREYTFAHYVDDNMRSIPDHYHAHGRPVGGFSGHGLRRPQA